MFKLCPGVSKANIIIMIFQPSVDSQSCMVNDCAFSEAICVGTECHYFV